MKKERLPLIKDKEAAFLAAAGKAHYRMNEAEARSKRLKQAKKAMKKKNSHPLMRLFVAAAGFALVLSCIGVIILTQAEIAEKKQELAALVEKAARLEESNDEYKSMLSEDDESAFMERYATEVLGYAYPNERRFYDTTGR